MAKGGFGMQEVVLSCPTLRQELLAALAEREMPIIFLPGELHLEPPTLRSYLQSVIDTLSSAARIWLCPSGCGGGTTGLRAGAAELIVPRTRDCIDILLSSDGGAGWQRDEQGMYMTASWAEYSRRSDIDYDRVMARLGRAAGEVYLRRLYQTVGAFYIVDTGCYNIRPVQEYLAPLAKLLDIEIIPLPGPCGILHRIANGQVDGDFMVIPPGGEVLGDSFGPDS